MRFRCPQPNMAKEGNIFIPLTSNTQDKVRHFILSIP